MFDLDPDEEVDFAFVKTGALGMRDRLKHIGIQSFRMTTGRRGSMASCRWMPKHRWDDIKAFAQATARMNAATIPTTISR